MLKFSLAPSKPRIQNTLCLVYCFPEMSKILPMFLQILASSTVGHNLHVESHDWKVSGCTKTKNPLQYKTLNVSGLFLSVLIHVASCVLNTQHVCFTCLFYTVCALTYIDPANVVSNTSVESRILHLTTCSS